MLRSFSWGDFTSFLFILLLIYYVIIGAVFYRFELVQLLKGKMPLPFFRTNAPGNDNDNLQAAFNSITQELENYFSVSHPAQLSKGEIFTAIASTLARYPSLKGSTREKQLYKYIREQCIAFYNIPVSEQELKQLW